MLEVELHALGIGFVSDIRGMDLHDGGIPHAVGSIHGIIFRDRDLRLVYGYSISCQQGLGFRLCQKRVALIQSFSNEGLRSRLIVTQFFGKGRRNLLKHFHVPGIGIHIMVSPDSTLGRLVSGNAGGIEYLPALLHIAASHPNRIDGKPLSLQKRAQ